jgi:hypothetical protein
MALFYSARLPPWRPGFDSRLGHVRLGTYSLGWRWPWSSLFVTSYSPAANFCTGWLQYLTSCPTGENKAYQSQCTNLCCSLVYLEFIQLLFLFPRWRIFQSLQWDTEYLPMKGIFYIKKLQAHLTVLIISKQAAGYMYSWERIERFNLLKKYI